MPSSLHEAIIELFRTRLVLAAELLERCLGQELPAFRETRLDSADLPKLKPAARHADLVVLHAGDAGPVLAVVVEVQLKTDKQKQKSWPDYLTGLYSRHDCPAMLLVVCPSGKTAQWAAGPIPIGHPGFVLRPLVLGPDLMPVVTDPAEAVAAPELAVLSGIAHGRDKNVRDAAFTAVAAVAAGNTDLAALYADVILAELPKALRETAEEELRARTIEYQSDFAKHYVAEGKAEGLAEGLAEGKAAAIIEVLSARGIEVTHASRARIMHCTDHVQLDEWLRRAATASTAGEVLA